MSGRFRSGAVDSGPRTRPLDPDGGCRPTVVPVVVGPGSSALDEQDLPRPHGPVRSVSGHRGTRVSGSSPLRSGHVDADDSLVAVLVGDHGQRRRVAVIDDGPARGDGGGDPLLGHLGAT